jgi:hypothetical protein
MGIVALVPSQKEFSAHGVSTLSFVSNFVGGRISFSLDGVNETGWKPILHCSPERRAMTRGHAEAIPVDRSRPRDGVKIGVGRANAPPPSEPDRQFSSIRLSS